MPLSCLSGESKQKDEDLLALIEKQTTTEGVLEELTASIEKLKQGVAHGNEEIHSLSDKQSKTEAALSQFEQKTSDIETELKQGLTSTGENLTDLQRKQNRCQDNITELLQKQSELQTIVSDLKSVQASVEGSLRETDYKQGRADDIVDNLQNRQLAADGSIADVREKQQDTSKIVDELRKSHAALEQMSYDQSHNQTRLDEMFSEFERRQTEREEETQKLISQLNSRLDAAEEKCAEVDQVVKETSATTYLMAAEQTDIKQKISEENRAMSLSSEARESLESVITDLTRKHKLLEAIVYDQKQVMDNMQLILQRKDGVIAGLQQEVYAVEAKKVGLEQAVNELKNNQQNINTLVEGLKKRESEKQESVQKLMHFLQNDTIQGANLSCSNNRQVLPENINILDQPDGEDVQKAEGSQQTTTDKGQETGLSQMRQCFYSKSAPTILEQEKFFSAIDLFQSVISFHTLRPVWDTDETQKGDKTEVKGDEAKGVDEEQEKGNEDKATVSTSDINLEEKSPMSSKNQNAETECAPLPTGAESMPNVSKTTDADKEKSKKEPEETANLPCLPPEKGSIGDGNIGNKTATEVDVKQTNEEEQKTDVRGQAQEVPETISTDAAATMKEIV